MLVKYILFTISASIIGTNIQAQVAYSFEEEFETINPMVYWTFHGDMMSGTDDVYTFDELDFTEGSQFLKINITIPNWEDPTASWYLFCANRNK